MIYRFELAQVLTKHDAAVTLGRQDSTFVAYNANNTDPDPTAAIG